MAYTVSQLHSMLAKRLRDSGEEKYTSASGIKLEALNVAVRDIVLFIIALSGRSKARAFNLLRSLISSDIDVSVSSSGVDLSSLSDRVNTLVNVYVKPSTKPDGYYAVIRDITALGRSKNMWLSGNDEYPVAYIKQNKIYVDIDPGSYPVNCDIYYIRDPKELVISSPSGYQTDVFELDDKFVNLTLDIAQRYCYIASQDIDQYRVFAQEAVNKFMMMSGVGLSQPVERSVGQFLRKQDEMGSDGIIDFNQIGGPLL